MSFNFLRTVFVLLAALGALAPTAHAQKSKDTVRFGWRPPISIYGIYLNPLTENRLVTDAAFDHLISFNNVRQKFENILAKSWKRIDPKTIEYDLRDDVLWHDGEKLTADDVVYTLNWLKDPKVRLRFKRRYSWISSVEKLGTHRLRIVAKRIVPTDLMRLATSIWVLPEHIFRPLTDKRGFARKPVGTGPYRVTSVDNNSGIRLLRNENFKHGSNFYPAASTRNIDLVPAPDEQTRTAMLLTGNIDIFRAIEHEAVENIAKEGDRQKVTVAQGQGIVYMTLDAAGRSQQKALTNTKVRRAIAMASNRTTLAKSAGVRGTSVPISALCLPLQSGCGYDLKPPNYDPATASQLLTEAGFPNGFDLTVTTRRETASVAEALASDLQKVGIRARVVTENRSTFAEKRSDGALQAQVSFYSAGSFPDASQPANFFFGNRGRDYARDSVINSLVKKGLGTRNPTERSNIYRQLFSRVNQQNFILPLSTLPNVYLHHKDVSVPTRYGNPNGIKFRDLNFDGRIQLVDTPTHDPDECEEKGKCWVNEECVECKKN
jgi:peptide/nickel transport system substrate-binding protein